MHFITSCSQSEREKQLLRNTNENDMPIFYFQDKNMANHREAEYIGPNLINQAMMEHCSKYFMRTTWNKFISVCGETDEQADQRKQGDSFSVFS